MEPGEALFRRESGRVVAALTRVFGLDNLALAEDVAQDAFCRAVEVWKLRGVPENPAAWLMTAAKNRAIDLLRRERRARNLVPELGRLLESEWTMVPAVNGLFSAETIKDDQLRMMFSCCDPLLSEQAQIALTLNLLCGFTAREIAQHLLLKRPAVEKTIERAKNVLQTSRNLFDLSDNELPDRLAAVQRVLYLLFNEGYHGASSSSAVRAELCREAMRLAALLLDNPFVATPSTHALCALMWLNAARLPARVDGDGELISLVNQDRSRWDEALIAQGVKFLELAARGQDVSEYHVEGAIAAVHARSARPEDTDWKQIVWLYDSLMQIRPSPVVALNRAIAVAQMSGPDAGIAAIREISGSERLASYPFLPAALGELELRAGQRESARAHFQAAVDLARNPMERRFLQQRVLEASKK